MKDTKLTQSKSPSGSQFPMRPEEFVKAYGKVLSPFERDEVLSMKDLIYYYNFTTNFKGTGRFVKDQLNYLEENPEKNNVGVLNNGFSNEQSDFLYDAKD